jgi:O-antigen ligase
LFSTFILSGADKSQQFWGVFGRNTGILSYLALIVILVVVAAQTSRQAFTRIVWSLILTVAIMSAYCLVQIAKLDPISWSAYFPFGTLGNVNFLSGFMGIGLTSIFVFATSKSLDIRSRMGLIILLFVGIFVLSRVGSTQGIVAFAFGICVFLLTKSFYVHKSLFILTLMFFVLGFTSLVFGLFDKGPLRSLVYQVTVLYRADYMHAGISMLMHRPLTGVGIDSYDDWYRAERGIISAVRTSLNRTANTAHNISIDLGAGGGFPLLVAYLSLLAAILFAIIRGLRQGLANDPVFMAITSSWLAYQVQASVSINQIGVGVWGWILGGAILGYSRIGPHLGDEHQTLGGVGNGSRKSSQRNQNNPNTPPASSVLLASLMLVIGFVLSFVPLKTDADFMSATKSGSGQKMLDISERLSVNSFMLAKSASASLNSNLTDVAKVLTQRFNTKFPRTISGYLIAYDNPVSSPSERALALEKIKELDPFVAVCFGNNSSAVFRELLEDLPSIEKYRLARGWGLVGELSTLEQSKYTFELAPIVPLQAKIMSFCER